ncbi:acyl-CoA dehydrogenase [Salinarimonas sp.]|uniref:acyl-CoA dehydrogenase n=1 Tax=Salinarimonas sp. TaxID=2766526 RepID=UPI0032D91BB4
MRPRREPGVRKTGSSAGIAIGLAAMGIGLGIGAALLAQRRGSSRDRGGDLAGSIRREILTKPIHGWARKALPRLSETEREALHAGESWWDAELLSGDPDWRKLDAVEAPRLSPREQAFLDGPCERLCAMLDDWKINREEGDLPPEVWRFMREEKFFGMIIPRSRGGLEFSAYAHSEVVRYIASRSIAAAVTVMVPNSLGPGELLLQFGTEAQKDHWLPRLADGREIPAFALTSEEAGSDAASMVDSGVVCRGEWEGEQVLGIRLNWSKRYITLAPVCTVLGLAFKLYDPDRLIGEDAEIGITCALVPTHLDGVEIGRRHVPSQIMFQNGPTTGHDVFIPLDSIIGGPACAGHGWTMLMSALAAGRGISLPSMASAAVAMAAHTSGAYSRVREQFGIPIGRFEGIQARLGPLAANAYALDAARRLTCAGLDEGRALAVVSGIMKAHATYRMREALDDAMDIHSGKAVIDGPSNYLLPLHRGVPIAITVEGANIVTRNLIIFGQGAIRAHPHMLDEMMALEERRYDVSLARFDAHLWKHVAHTARTLARATQLAWSDGLLAPAPDRGRATPIYRQMTRWSAALALTTDALFLTVGGGLKKKEMISARMGDILSELYFLSATVKRWEDDGRPAADFPLVRFAADRGFARIRIALDEVLANFPNPWVGGALRALLRPGRAVRAPDDALVKACSDLLYEPSQTRERIVGRIFGGCERESVRVLGEAWEAVLGAERIASKLRKVGVGPEEAVRSGALSPRERARYEETTAAVRRAVAVDDFSQDELARLLPAYRRTTPEAVVRPQEGSHERS